MSYGISAFTLYQVCFAFIFGCIVSAYLGFWSNVLLISQKAKKENEERHESNQPSSQSVQMRNNPKSQKKIAEQAASVAKHRLSTNETQLMAQSKHVNQLPKFASSEGNRNIWSHTNGRGWMHINNCYTYRHEKYFFYFWDLWTLVVRYLGYPVSWLSGKLGLFSSFFDRYRPGGVHGLWTDGDVPLKFLKPTHL